MSTKKCTCNASASVWVMLAGVAVVVACAPRFFDRIWGSHKATVGEEQR